MAFAITSTARGREKAISTSSPLQKNLLNFGHGKYACPGRFFASLEIKVILVRLVMNYDFKLTPHQGRPANLKAHEFLFPNPDGELLIRARGMSAESPF